MNWFFSLLRRLGLSKRRRGPRYYRPAEYFLPRAGDPVPPPILLGPFPTPEPFPQPPPEPAPVTPRPSTLARLTFDDFEEAEEEPDEADEEEDDDMGPGEALPDEPEAPPPDEVARMRKEAETAALAGEHKVFLWTVPGPGTLAEALNRLKAEGRVTAEFREDAEGGYILYRPVLSQN